MNDNATRPSGDAQPARKRVSIEDVVDALSGECDGARSRDGRGFSRSDAQEGGRLAAMKKRGMAWTTDDARKAMEIVGKYAKQAGDLLGEGRKARSQGIEAALRNGYVECADPVDDNQKAYNYAGFSPGGKRVHFWRFTKIDDAPAFQAALGAIAKLRHGARRIQVDFSESAEMTMNGQKRRARRSEIDFCGTTQPAILELAKRHGFLLEPAIEKPVEEEIDRLRLQERAAWIYEGVRDGRKGAWVVFDLARKHEPFSAAVKTYCRDATTRRPLYSCEPRDDWNWYVEWDDRTRDLVRGIIKHFGFAASDSIGVG